MKKENSQDTLKDILLKMKYDNSMTLSENVLVLEQKPDHLMPWQPDNPINTGVPRAKMTGADLVRGMNNAQAARKDFIDKLSKLTIDDWQHFLDWVGLVPVIGDAVDVVNAVGYLIRACIEHYDGNSEKGNQLLVEFTLSIVAVLPVLGSPIKLALKNIPFSTFLKGGEELFKSFKKAFESLSPTIQKGAKIALETIKKKLNDTINWIQKLIGKIKNSKIVRVLSDAVRILENIFEAIVKLFKPVVKPIVKTSEKLGKQTVKWAGKIIDSPAGGTWFKTMKNISKEACGPERQQSEWAKQRISDDVFLIGGQFYGNIVCDVLSALSWTSGPLGPLLAASIEVENAQNYYEQGEKLMGDIQLVLGFLPFLGTLGKGVINTVGKGSADVLASPSFLYKLSSWIEGEGVIKLTSDEVKAITQFGKEALKKDASTAMKNFAFKIEWFYKNAANLGLGPNIVVGMRMTMPKLLSAIERVFDTMIRLSFYLGSAKAVEMSEGKEIELEKREQVFQALEKTYTKKDSFSGGKKAGPSRAIQNLPQDEKRLFKGNYSDTTDQ